MAPARLKELAQHDEGRLIIRIYGRGRDELVLADSDTVGSRSDLRELDGFECLRLAAAATDGPFLVVESIDGDYLVLPEATPDTDRHVPLEPSDVEVLRGPAAAVGRFGRRSDDLIPLSPWSPDALQVTFDPDDDAFADVPLVRHEDGRTTVERGALPPAMHDMIDEHLHGRGEEGRFGVVTNVFGEYALHEVGEVVEPHHDLRRSTVLDVAGLVEGVASLADLGLRLHMLAERCEAAAQEGWTLPVPVTDGLAYPERHM